MNTMPTMPRAALAGMIASLFVLPTQAGVTDTAQPAGQLQTVKVVGTARTYDARRDDTATKIVVTSEEMLRQGDTNIVEALKRLPGITVAGAQGRANEIRMRGLGNGYTQVLLNGEPLPPGISIDTLPPDSIERIEVMRAATADLSTQAIAGTINIILKRKIETAQKELKTGVRSDGRAPSYNANLILSDKKGALAWSVNAGLAHDEHRGGIHAEERHADLAGRVYLVHTFDDAGYARSDGLTLSPRLVWTRAPGETLTFQPMLSYNDFRGYNEQVSHVALGPASNLPRSDSDFGARVASARSEIAWNKSLAGGARIELKTTSNVSDRDSYSYFRMRHADGTLRRDHKVDNKVADLGHNLTGKFTQPLADSHVLAFGIDGGVTRRHEDRVQRQTSPLAGEPLDNLDEWHESDVTRLAAFAQDEWTISPRWSVYLGLRWEGLRIDSRNESGGGAANRYHVLSPIAQTLWKLPGTKSDQVRLALTRTYRAPNPFQILARRFRSLNNTMATPDYLGNPNLKPELASGLDLSFEHYLGQGGLLSASTYVRRIDDLIRSQLSQIGGLWTSTTVNGGEAVSRGVELEAKLPLRLLWAGAPAIDLRANAARNWSEVSTVPGPGNRLDAQTPVSGTLGIDYKANDAWSLGGSYSYQGGDRTRRAVDEWSVRGIRRTLDLYANWKLAPSAQLRLSVANALHQDNVSGGTFVYAANTADLLRRQPGWAVVRANLDLKF